MNELIQSITSPSYEPYANMDTKTLLVAIITIIIVLTPFAYKWIKELKSQNSRTNF